LKSLELQNVSKYFIGPAGSKLNVLEDISFSIETPDDKSNFISILASFASGKTTLLKIIAAIEKPDRGNVLLMKEPHLRPTGKIPYIPERPSSFPWQNVEENINFVSLNKTNDLKELIDSVGLTGYENHHPHNESLGFRFRISLARALAVKPDFILLDDPFKRMSSITKDEIYELLRSIEEKFKVSFILATTNIAEAVYLSNKIFLMKKNPGKIIEEIKLDAETLRKKGLDSHERFISLRNEIENSFQASGERLQTEVHH
jgi:NitT/TauT family transport system ATP-binding protein